MASSLPQALPGPYRGGSTLFNVIRATAFTLGLIYGDAKLYILRKKKESELKAAEKKMKAEKEALKKKKLAELAAQGLPAPAEM